MTEKNYLIEWLDLETGVIFTDPHLDRLYFRNPSLVDFNRYQPLGTIKNEV